MENAMTLLFRSMADRQDAPIIELQDKTHKPVGALYLNRLPDKEQFAINEACEDERYFLYVDGVGVYFTYWKKLQGK